MLASCQAVSVDLDQKYLKVKRVAAGGNSQLVFGDTIKVGAVFNAHHEVCLSNGVDASISRSK